MKVLTFIPYYLPAKNAGGSVQTLYNLNKSLVDINFKIVTQNVDAYDDVPFKGINPGEWNMIDGNEVFYLTNRWLHIKQIISLINHSDVDILYLNSFFSFKFSILMVLLRKLHIINKRILVAPRGELSRGAMENKLIKKMIYMFFAKFFRLYKDVYWQASTNEEYSEIKGFCRRNKKILIARDIVILPEYNTTDVYNKEPGTLKIVFVSRIDPKKNLFGALDLVSKIKGKIEFNIYGPIGDIKYWESCQGIINKFSSNITIFYKGLVSQNEVLDVFKSSDIFLFITKGENFGHVIIESLISGCPVFISDLTPWNDIAGEKAGWVFDLNKEDAMANQLQQIVGMNAKEMNVYRGNAYNYAKKYLAGNSAIAENKCLFDTVINN
jgi:glycosyltransferase involved in cell wall biosynthesis